jgi:hypothetical protein
MHMRVEPHIRQPIPRGDGAQPARGKAQPDPYAAPTDEEWAAIDARMQEAERIWRVAQQEYLARFTVWKEASDRWSAELHEWLRLKALHTPVREYVTKQLSTIIYTKGPPSAKKIDPYHRPAVSSGF